jgi:hypothetical protein
MAAKAGVAKVAVIALATGSVVGGGVAVQHATQAPDPPRAAAPEAAPATGEAAGSATVRPAGQSSHTHARDANRAKARAGAPATREHASKGHDRRRDDHTRKHDVTAEKSHGFEPVPGTSNGARARAFARERGKGRHRGLDKQSGIAGAGAKHVQRGRGHHRKAPKKPHPAKKQPQGHGHSGDAPPAGPLSDPPGQVPAIGTPPQPPKAIRGAKGSGSANAQRPVKNQPAE